MKAESNHSRFTIAQELVEALDSKFFRTLRRAGSDRDIEISDVLNGRADIGTIAENMPRTDRLSPGHLNLMQEAGILVSSKEDRHVYYHVNGKSFMEKVLDISEKINKCVAEWLP